MDAARLAVSGPVEADQSRKTDHDPRERTGKDHRGWREVAGSLPSKGEKTLNTESVITVNSCPLMATEPNTHQLTHEFSYLFPHETKVLNSCFTSKFSPALVPESLLRHSHNNSRVCALRCGVMAANYWSARALQKNDLSPCGWS